MAKVLLEMSMSLDGCTTGPDVSPEEPMGRGGEQLHEWMFEGPLAESERNRSSTSRHRRRDRRPLPADLGIVHWGEEPTFHAPVFVVTNRPAGDDVKAGGTSYIFVTGGIDEALGLARDAAGRVMRSSAEAPISRASTSGRARSTSSACISILSILGGGGRLFDDGPSPSISLRPIEVTDTPRVTHLTYEVVR